MPRAHIGDIDIEFESLGEGEPLLLIGGLGAQLISWDDGFCEVLASRGYHVVRFDNRDSGLSTILEDRGVPDLLGLLLGTGRAPYLLEDMAGDVLGLLDHLGIARAHLVGLSMGGMIAQVVALRHPDRVSTLVAALSGPAGRPAAVPSPEVVEALLRTPGSTFEDRVSDAVELRRALAGGGSDFDEVVARRRAVAQIERAHHPAGTMRQAAAVLASPNVLTSLHGLTVPAMVVHGEIDPLVPYASAQAAARAMPDAIFVGVPGLGHDLPAGAAWQLVDRIAEFHASRALKRWSYSGK